MLLTERWAPISEFPNYSVSDLGNVRNQKLERDMAITTNQRGIPKVALSVDGLQYQRALAPLVAREFVEGETTLFNTPIHLDGDQQNCFYENLVWRPRWFAVRYHAQFRTRSEHTINVPIKDTVTGVVYKNSLDAALSNGLLERDLVMAILNNTVAFPVWHEFEIIDP